MTSATAPLIGPDEVAFISSGVGMSAASCRPGALPNLSRCTGARVSGDYRSVTLLMGATPAAALIDDVRRTGAIAAVFSKPSTHETMQLKGTDARIVPTEPGDETLAQGYVEAFVAELVPFGYPASVIRAFLTCPPEDLIAVTFTVAAAFSQTPGPQAGEPLGREP